MISDYIKYTNSENLIGDSNEIVRIINIIETVDITNDNIHCLLKLISNLVKNNYYICIDKFVNYIINNNLLLEGDVISLINIYTSFKFNDIDISLKMIDDYNIHKTASYVPIFKNLIMNKNFDRLKDFYRQYIIQNINIVNKNREIKEYNNEIRIYNEKIKILKKKINEINTIHNELKEFDYYNNDMKYEDNFSEINHKTESNLIELSNSIIRDIILLAIDNNDNGFINEILNNINNPSLEIMKVLKIYFTKNNYEYIYTNVDNNRCLCCNSYIPNNVISEDDRNKIMNRISDKILSITRRYDNNQKLTKLEKDIIKNKWIDFQNILNDNKFDIIIDGANLGYLNIKQFNDINFNLIESTIKNIQSKTDKKILLIIHQRHITKIKFIANIVVYITPNNVNDDWFWLYGSLYSRAYILTNDLSRDHGYMIAYQNEIKRWIQFYQINITEEIRLKDNMIMPGIITDNNVIHIINNENLAFNIICVHMV